MNTIDLNGRYAVVTGGASGLGYAELRNVPTIAETLPGFEISSW